MFLDDAVAAARKAALERMESAVPDALERRIENMPPPPEFRGAVKRSEGGARVIAEIKRSSPSAGPLRSGARAAVLAEAYRDSGADALSVITCGYRFDGEFEDLLEASTAAPGLPVLRKDFIVEPYQVLEARASGASAVLLIAAALTAGRLRGLVDYAGQLGLNALVEAHGEADLDRALESGAGIVGINNRDLETLEVDLETTERLLPLVPSDLVLVSESGIRTSEDLYRMSSLGVDAVLIGEALMRAGDPGAKLRELMAGSACRPPAGDREAPAEKRWAPGRRGGA